jgi:hypothetical protein
MAYGKMAKENPTGLKPVLRSLLFRIHQKILVGPLEILDMPALAVPDARGDFIKIGRAHV